MLYPAELLTQVVVQPLLNRHPKDTHAGVEPENRSALMLLLLASIPQRILRGRECEHGDSLNIRVRTSQFQPSTFPCWCADALLC